MNMGVAETDKGRRQAGSRLSPGRKAKVRQELKAWVEEYVVKGIPAYIALEKVFSWNAPNST